MASCGYQHNEQARAALLYSSRKPTRRNAKHQADGSRKRHNKEKVTHMRRNRHDHKGKHDFWIWPIEAADCGESSCEVSSDLARPGSHLGRQRRQLTSSCYSGSWKQFLLLAIRMVPIATIFKGRRWQIVNHSRQPNGSDSKTPFPCLANDPAEPS